METEVGIDMKSSKKYEAPWPESIRNLITDLQILGSGSESAIVPKKSGSITLCFNLKVLSNGAGGGWRVVSIDPFL